MANKKTKVLVSISIFVSLLFLWILLADFFIMGEHEEHYCKQKYGFEFDSRWDGNVGYFACVSITENGTLIKYYINEGYPDSCEEKFWKINDCPSIEK